MESPRTEHKTSVLANLYSYFINLDEHEYYHCINCLVRVLFRLDIVLVRVHNNIIANNCCPF